MSKSSYLLRCLAGQFSAERHRCPNCGSMSNRVVDRKFVITQLRRCGTCLLLFRTPTDRSESNQAYYENEYAQGFTASLPSDAALVEMKRCNFANINKTSSYHIAVLSQLGLKPGSRLFDYGCSWGYGSYQFARAGFDVTAFEVAPTRRRFAHEKLGVLTFDDMEHAVGELADQVDCFFSAHVLEHVPAPSKAFAYAMRMLKPGGLFLSFTPNGSAVHRAVSPNWSKAWGEVHPQFIDDIFLDHNFKLSPRAIGSSPVGDISLPVECRLNQVDKLAGGELVFVARKTGETWA
jgi:2-polyprenyl-3-methyl-5-hydroxy-6-metoxy-1,4-benzoquinol methylase